MKNIFDMHFFVRTALLVLIIAFGLPGCVNTSHIYQPSAISENIAVNNLFYSAQELSLALDYEGAQAKIERAIRIESENPYLWFELAQLASLREEYNRARELAERASRFAVGVPALHSQINTFLRQL